MDSINHYGESIRRKKVRQLRKYYNENGLNIIGLNDNQGIYDKTLSRKSLLDYIVEMLDEEETSVININAFCQLFNRTEHIDYFLKSNLSLKEIKDIQLGSVLVALGEKLKTMHFPKVVGKLGYINKKLYREEENDSKFRLADTIRDSKEPIIIYSCGLKDLMLECSSDIYDEMIVAKEGTVIKVMNGIENNINNILSLNNQADIFVLGACLSELLRKKENVLPVEVLLEYNKQLSILCNKYGVQYVDIESIYQGYTSSKKKDLATYKLARLIIEHIYIRKFWSKKSLNISNNDFTIEGNGTNDLLVYLYQSLMKLEEDYMSLSGREVHINEQKKLCIQKELETVEKVLLKKM